MNKLDPVLRDKLMALVHSMGYEWVGCEWLLQGRVTVFRLYIDIPAVSDDSSKGKPQKGVTLDDCSRVSHQVSALLDVLDTIPGRYVLEVSSPGIERPLFELTQYQKYIGRVVKIKLCRPITGRRQYKGVLQAIKGEDIYLLVDKMEPAVQLPFSLIEKANLVEEREIQKTKGVKRKLQ